MLCWDIFHFPAEHIFTQNLHNVNGNRNETCYAIIENITFAVNEHSIIIHY